MKPFTILNLILLTLCSCKTDKVTELGKKSCDCFKSIKYDGDKLKFDIAEQRCMQQMYDGSLNIQPYYPDKSNLEICKALYSEMNKNCDCYNEVLAKFFEMGKESTMSKIKDKSKCNILRNGHFKDLVEINAICTIQDNYYTVNFLNRDTYTKSRMSWLDSCTFQLAPYETTDSIMKRHLHENPVVTIKIIDIVNDTITYETEYHGNYSLSQMVKID